MPSQFALACALFIAAHVVPAAPRVRGFARQAPGWGLHLAIHSLVPISAHMPVLPFAAIAAGRARPSADTSTILAALIGVAVNLLFLAAGALGSSGWIPS